MPVLRTASTGPVRNPRVGTSLGVAWHRQVNLYTTFRGKDPVKQTLSMNESIGDEVVAWYSSV